LKSTQTFDARKLMTKAKMDAGSEGDVPVWPSLKVKVFRMLVGLWVHVRCRHHGHNPVALLHPNAVELDVLPHEAGL